MAKKPSMGLDAPPARRKATNSTNMTAVRDDLATVTITHQVTAAEKRALALLAINTGKKQRELLSEAIALLEEKYGAME